jgi:hypothetical protein
MGAYVAAIASSTRIAEQVEVLPQHGSWSERPIDERTHRIEIHAEPDVVDGRLLSQLVVDLAREGKRWLPRVDAAARRSSDIRLQPW